MKTGKDSALSSAIRKLAEKYISRFGHILSVEIDSSTRTLIAQVLLKGEPDPIVFKVIGFEIIQQGKTHLVILRSVSASRHWMDTLAKDYLQGRAFKIPAPVAKAISLLA